MTISTKTIAITVTYNPNTTILAQQLLSLESQCAVVLVDNGSTAETLDKIKEIQQNFNRLKIIALGKNTGISNAQNIGIKYILKELPLINFILLLDHDSIPSINMIDRLENRLLSLINSGIKAAAIGPLLYDPRDKKYLGFHIIRFGLWRKIIPKRNSPPVECHSLNSSGSLISLEAFKHIGQLEENFFIDHVETEWCFRAINKGYKIFGCPEIIMDHLMGDEVSEYWFLGRKRMPYRSPRRHYYISRNSMLMQKRSYIPCTWKFWNIIKLIFTYVYFGFVAKESKTHRCFIRKGITDGLKGITGKLQTN